MNGLKMKHQQREFSIPVPFCSAGKKRIGLHLRRWLGLGLTFGPTMAFAANINLAGVNLCSFPNVFSPHFDFYDQRRCEDYNGWQNTVSVGFHLPDKYGYVPSPATSIESITPNTGWASKRMFYFEVGKKVSFFFADRENNSVAWFSFVPAIPSRDNNRLIITEGFMDTNCTSTRVWRNSHPCTGTQSISFSKPADQTYDNGDFSLTASGGGSGNPVTFSSTTPSVCTTSGTNGRTLHIVALGTCTINANQAGNSQYRAATQVSRSFTIHKGNQYINFSKPADKTYGDADFSLTASAGASGQPVTFSSATPSICNTGGINGGTLHIVAPGICTLNAYQAGNGQYNAAPQVSRSLTINAVCQLYAVQDDGLNDTQFFIVNPDTLEVKALGESYPGYDIEALDVHPNTDALYAASGDDTDNPGHLYTVNTQTGALTDIGSTGFAEIEGLTFHTDGTLWAWAKGDGLISIDPQNGPTGSLVFSSKVKVEDLTWNNHGTKLYAAQNTNLWVSDGETVEKACDLPGHTEALEMLPDNRLLIGVHGNKKILEFEVMDLDTCDLVQGLGIPTDYDDVEGIAWPTACAK